MEVFAELLKAIETIIESFESAGGLFVKLWGALKAYSWLMQAYLSLILLPLCALFVGYEENSLYCMANILFKDLIKSKGLHYVVTIILM